MLEHNNRDFPLTLYPCTFSLQPCPCFLCPPLGEVSRSDGGGKNLQPFALNNMPEPMFEEIQNGFRVTIFKTTQKTTQKISTRERIYKELKLNPKITREELADKLGKSVSTIKEHLSGLKSKDRVERIGSDRDGYWQVK
jgi:predicted HTH transcriptional regulator